MKLKVETTSISIDWDIDQYSFSYYNTIGECCGVENGPGGLLHDGLLHDVDGSTWGMSEGIINVVCNDIFDKLKVLI